MSKSFQDRMDCIDLVLGRGDQDRKTFDDAYYKFLDENKESLTELDEDNFSDSMKSMAAAKAIGVLENDIAADYSTLYSIAKKQDPSINLPKLRKDGKAPKLNKTMKKFLSELEDAGKGRDELAESMRSLNLAGLRKPTKQEVKETNLSKKVYLKRNDLRKEKERLIELKANPKIKSTSKKEARIKKLEEELAALEAQLDQEQLKKSRARTESMQKQPEFHILMTTSKPEVKSRARELLAKKGYDPADIEYAEIDAEFNNKFKDLTGEEGQGESLGYTAQEWQDKWGVFNEAESPDGFKVEGVIGSFSAVKQNGVIIIRHNETGADFGYAADMKQVNSVMRAQDKASLNSAIVQYANGESGGMHMKILGAFVPTYTKEQERITKKKMTKALEKLNKEYDMRMKFLTQDEMLKKVQETLSEEEAADAIAEIQDGAEGWSITTDVKTGDAFIYVRPGLIDESHNFVMGHEVGHVLMQKLAANADNELLNEIYQDFDNWMAEHGQDGSSLVDMIHSRKPYEMSRDFLRSVHNKEYVSELPAYFREYLNSFDEYSADMMARALQSKQKNRNKFWQFWYDLGQLAKRFFGYGEEVRYLDKISRYKGMRNFSETILFKAFSKSMLRAWRSEAMKSARDQVSALISASKDEYLRESKSVWVQKFADLMHKQRGSRTSDNSFYSAKSKMIGRFETKLTDLLGAYGNLSETDEREILELLYSGKKTKSANVNKLREFLRDLDRYERIGTKTGMDNAPIDKDLLPLTLDLETLTKNKETFKTIVGHEKYRIKRNKLARNLGFDVKKKDFVEFLYQELADTLVDSFSLREKDGQSARTTHLLDFLTAEDRGKFMSTFMQPSIKATITKHIMNTVKRTEYGRRFGRPTRGLIDKATKYRMNKMREQGMSEKDVQSFGEKQKIAFNNMSALEIYKTMAMADGVGPDILERMQDSLNAEIGMHGRGTREWLNSHLKIPKGKGEFWQMSAIDENDKDPMWRPLRDAQGGLMAAANIMVLGLATISSLVEPIGIAIRSQEVGKTYRALKDHIKSSDLDAEFLMRELGYISEESILDVMRNEYGGNIMTGTARKINDTYFKLIGLDQWTKTMRIIGGRVALESFKAFASGDDLDGFKLRQLDELGLRAGDIRLTDKGRVKLLSYDEYNSATQVEKDRDDRVRDALVEFVDQAVLRPNPSNRPLWASNPHFALLFHLKSFMYAFHNTILIPSVREAKVYNNYKPLLMMTAYIPAAVMTGLLKDAAKLNVPGGGYKSDWGMFDYMWDAAQQSGLTGIAQPLIDLFEGRFGSPVMDPVNTFGNMPVPIRYW